MPRSRGRTLVGVAPSWPRAGWCSTTRSTARMRRPRSWPLPGIGPWTAGYIAMRALRDPDAFIPGDAGVRHGLARLGCDPSPREVARVSEPWRPVSRLRRPAPVGGGRRMTTLFKQIPSPVGDLLLAGDGRELRALWIDGQRWAPAIGADWRRADEPFDEAARQLGEYFAGERTAFTLPLRLAGTPFQNEVWHALISIPFGESGPTARLPPASGARGRPVPSAPPTARTRSASSSRVTG